MTRKELVLLLHNNRDKSFVRNILTGSRPDLEMKWTLHQGQHYVFPGKINGRSLSTEKAWAKAQKTNEHLRLSTEADCEWFCDNYNSFLDREESIEPTTV